MTVGIVIAATMPIMPSVINTSAKVNAIFDFVRLKAQPTATSEVIPLLAGVSTPRFLPLSGKNPRAPPPEIVDFSCFYPLFNFLTL